MRSYEHIAFLLMLMLKESGKARFRLSRKSLQEISGRDVIKSALINNIAEWMEGTAFILPLADRGYAIISQSSLEGIALIKIGDVVAKWDKIGVDELHARVDEEGDDEE